MAQNLPEESVLHRCTAAQNLPKFQPAIPLVVLLHSALRSSVLDIMRNDCCPRMWRILNRQCELILLHMSLSVDPVLVSAFTRDPVADRDTICQSTSCQAIVHKGEPYIYVGRKDGKPGRYVCQSCYQRYKANSDAITLSRDALFAGPNPDVIRRSVSAARSKGTVNPPQVVAINPAAGPMPPIMPPPPLLHPVGRPNVRVPTAAWDSPSDPPAPMQRLAAFHPNAIGYTPNHLAYAAERNRRAHAPYVSPPIETITLSISAVFDSGKRSGRSRGTPIGNICEGVRDVDARMTAPRLRELALETIIPCIRQFCSEFPWQTEEFVVRDEAWVDLAKYAAPTAPYFYHSCLHENSKKNSKGPVFKSKTFALNVVVPHAQWIKYQDFQTRTTSSTPGELSFSRTQIAAGSRHRSLRQSLEAAVGPASRIPPSEKSSTGHALFLPENRTGVLSTEVPDQSGTLPKGIVSKTQPITLPSSKRGHQYSSSLSSITTRSPPSKRSAHPRGDVPLPNEQDIKEALRFGGAEVQNIEQILKQTAQMVDFHPIPTRPFTEIVKRENHQYNLATADLFPGQIRLDPNHRSIIGIGAFKTTQAAQLVLLSPPASGLGSTVGRNVVAKRPYNRRETPNGEPPFKRYSCVDELVKLCREASALYWAKALLSVTYDFVDDALEASTEQPDFEIPRLRFVEAGLALVRTTASTGGPRSAKQGTVVQSYLIEELLDVDAFVKFIHNGICRPIPDLAPADHNIAEFLAFTQHVQYIETKGLGYISDYQGSPPLLTDPQILTHPTVGEGKNIFCEGNLEKGVAEFENEHICNVYCKWPGFKLVEFKRAPDSKGSVMNLLKDQSAIGKASGSGAGGVAESG